MPPTECEKVTADVGNALGAKATVILCEAATKTITVKVWLPLTEKKARELATPVLPSGWKMEFAAL